MGLQTKRRVLLSGTPIQNDLTEYYSLLHFVNPGMLGTPVEFRRKYEKAILTGQDANSTDNEQKKAQEKLLELTQLVNKCMIRRTSALLNKYLPVKFEMVVCVGLSQTQKEIYKSFIKSDSIKRSLRAADGESSSKKNATTTLANITSLKKLCNHPDLIFDKISEKAEGFEDCARFLPPGYSLRVIFLGVSLKYL